MKKGVKLILALCSLAVIIAAWQLVVRLTPEETEAAETTTFIYLVETDPATLTGIEYGSGEEVWSFVFTGAGWQNPSDEHMPLNQTKIGESASALTTVAANRFVSGDAAKSAEYGLDAPACTVRLTYSDGSTVVYNIGAKNIHTGEYYFNVEGEAAVYSVNAALLEYCSAGYEELLQLDEIKDIDSGAVTLLTANTAAGNKSLVPGERTEKTVNDEGAETESTVRFFTLTNEADAETELDEETGNAVLAGVLAPVVLDCADYYAEPEELAAYGLDAPVKLTVTYTEELTVATESSSTGTITETYVYEISYGFVTAEDGTVRVYMRLPASDMVFRIDASAFSILF